ncbi:MAG: hypothetical protein ACR2FE_06210 [Aeromicrobium sp.]
MTAQADVPVSLARSAEDIHARMVDSARSMFLRGLAVLAAAVLLGIAEALAMWMGALIVAAGLLVLAAFAAVAGLVTKWWS